MSAKAKVRKTPISTTKLSIVVYIHHPNYAGGINRMISVLAGLDKNTRTCSKK
jgi:hypothetical protein